MALNTTSKQVVSSPCRFSSCNKYSLWRATVCNLRTWSAKNKWLFTVIPSNLTRFSRATPGMRGGCIKPRRPHLVITISFVLARFICSLLSLAQLCTLANSASTLTVAAARVTRVRSSANFTKLVSSLRDRPPCVDGDSAIQWEWSNFDPSQDPNPLTDYDKTLHIIDYIHETTRNPKVVPIDRRACGQIREI